MGFSKRVRKLFRSKKKDAAGSSTPQHAENEGKASQGPPSRPSPPQQQQVAEGATQKTVVKEDLPKENSPVQEDSPAEENSPAKETVPKKIQPIEETTQDEVNKEQGQGHDLWAEAFRLLEKREPALVADYLKHINTFHGSGSDSNTQGLDAQSAKPVIEQLLATREEKQWSISLFDKDIKIRAQVEKLVKFCIFTDEVVKQALRDQTLAALAWSGVSILLPLINSGQIQHASMLDGFGYIGEVQLYWKIFEQEDRLQAQPRQNDIRQALTEIYSHIVEYQARVICHLSTAQLSRAWEKMSGSNDWDGQKQTIAKMDENCTRLITDSDRMRTQEQRDIQLQEIQESRKILSQIHDAILKSNDNAQERHRNDEEKALLQDLSSNYEQFKNVNPKRVDGTCEWFFKNDDFRKWRARESSSLLWVSASPGCGKSVLSRALIDENRLSNDVATTIVCYHFFKTEVDGQMDSASALSALIHQLLVQDPTGQMFLKVLQSHKKHGNKLRGNFEELWRVLIACAQSYPSGEIIVVLDALDECGTESRKVILQALNPFLTDSAQKMRLKFLVASRPYDDIEMTFQRYTESERYFRVDGDEKSAEIGQEINIVIDIRVKELAGGFDEADQKAIADRLKAMENRTYLWLHLTFDIIENQGAFCRKPSQFKELLRSLPTDVGDAYEQILNHISPDPKKQRMTRALLELVLAARRPLTLDEANYALTLATSDREFSSPAEINEDLWPKDSFKNVVKDISGLLITVCDSRLVFLHLTVREFLIGGEKSEDENNEDEKKWQWRGRLTMEDSHHTMASACVDILDVVVPDAMKTLIIEYWGDLVWKLPFLEYSWANWSFHYNSQHTDGQQKLITKSLKVCTPADGQSERFAELYRRTGAIDRYAFQAGVLNSELHFACVLGLEPVVAYILEGMDVTSETFIGVYDNAIFAAVRGGHANIVRRLVKSAEDFPGHNAMHSHALTQAIREVLNFQRLMNSYSNHWAVLRTLLDNAHIFIDDDHLEYALRWGSREVVSLILNHVGDGFSLSEKDLKFVAMNIHHGHEVMALLFERMGDKIEVTEYLLLNVADNYKRAKEIMEILMDKRGQEVRISKGVLEKAAQNDKADLLFMLLERRPAEVMITEEFLKAVLSNIYCGLEMMQRLFQYKREEITITEELVNTAVSNWKFGVQLLRLLMGNEGFKSQVLLTTKTLEVAAKNDKWGYEIVEVLLSRAGKIIPLSNAVFQKAAKNEQGGKIMECLLEKGGEFTITDSAVLQSAAESKYLEPGQFKRLLEKWGDIPISSEILESAAGNERHGLEIIECLLTQNEGAEIAVIDTVLIIAARNEDQGAKIFKCLLEKGDDIPISNELFEYIAERARCGPEIIEYLLEKKGGDITISDAVLKSAARNLWRPQEMLDLLLKKRGGETSIPDAAFEGAAGNWRQGLQILKWLAEKKGGEKPIPNAALEVAAGNGFQAEEVVGILLREERGDFTITEAVLKKAASNIECGPKVMEMLLRADETATITAGVIEEATGNSRQAFEIIRVILKKRGNQIIPVSAKARAIARYNDEGQKILDLLNHAEARGWAVRWEDPDQKDSKSGDEDSGTRDSGLRGGGMNWRPDPLKKWRRR